MLLWVDPNDNDTNTRIQNAIQHATHLRRDGELTTLMRCRAEKSRNPDVWTNPMYCLQANEKVTLLRVNAPGEQDFCFIRTSNGQEGFVLTVHIDATKVTRITRVSSTSDALAVIQGDLKGYIALPPSKFRVMTNNVRMENGQRNFNAGSDMASAMRSLVSTLSSVFSFVSISEISVSCRDTVAQFLCSAPTSLALQGKWPTRPTCF
jgi:hypothetical protein